MDALLEGPQTRLSDLVREHAHKARNVSVERHLPEPLLTVAQTCRYLSQLPELEDADSADKRKYFRQRDVEQILDEGVYPTCSDYGVVFRGLMIAQEIPTFYVETFHRDYIFGDSFHTHSFGRIFYDGGCKIVDPLDVENSLPGLFSDEIEIFPYVILDEGLDSWELGIESMEDLHTLREYNQDILRERYHQIHLKYNSQ